MKKSKLFFLFIILLSTFNLCSCSITLEGNTLHGFTQRMNTLHPDYNMTESGYIYDNTEKTLTKYYLIDEVHIMLCFEIDKENKLSSMNIVFDNLNESNTEQIKFIKDCITSFCNDIETSQRLIDESNLPEVLYKADINTVKKEIGNTEILIDVTDIGCVISVVQNTP